MTQGFIVAGTDTGIGKTVFSAALTGAFAANYWKPIQAGIEGETDTQTVARLSGLPEGYCLASAYLLKTPCSPHLAAEIDGIAINPARLELPDTTRPLIVELAGGLMVPITRAALQIDFVGYWQMPVILCARTSLGTINHTLLSVEALQRRELPLHGIAFIGEENADTERTICELAGVRRLGRLPWLPQLDAASLRAAFLQDFRLEDFQ